MCSYWGRCGTGGDLWGLKSPPPASALCLWIRCELSAVSPVPCLPVYCHVPYHDGHGFTFWNCQQASMKAPWPSQLRKWIIFHSSKKAAKIDSEALRRLSASSVCLWSQPRIAHSTTKAQGSGLTSSCKQPIMESHVKSHCWPLRKQMSLLVTRACLERGGRVGGDSSDFSVI